MKAKTPEKTRSSAPPARMIAEGARKAKPQPEPIVKKLTCAEQKELDANLLRFSKKKVWEAIGELIERGARDSAKDIFGYSALTYLAEEGKVDLIRELMRNGCRISISEQAARAAYIKAVQNRQRETIEYFLNNSDFLDKNALELEEFDACTELLLETYLGCKSRDKQ
ncbi:MAG: hypothetical protein QXH30_03035 [Candidatus Bilamarchaeaceae archaeon]